MEGNRAAIAAVEKAARNLPVGSRLTFDEMSAMAGVDVRRMRSVVYNASRHLERHHDRRLASVKGVGYQVCRAGEERGVLPRNPAPDKGGHLILNVMPIDDPTGEHGSKPGEPGNLAMLVVYRALGDNGEDKAIRKLSGPDGAVVEFLRTRM